MLTYEEKLNQDTEWALQEGSMHFEDRSAVHATMRSLAKVLRELDIDYAVVGGMAMFLHGYRRFTEDVDVIVTRDGLAKIHKELEGRGYLRPFENSKNLRDTRTGVKIDFLISGQYPADGKPGPVAFPVPSEAAVEIKDIKTVSLAKLVELKIASGRRIDLADVVELVKSLSLPRDLLEKADSSLRATYAELWDEAEAESGNF